MRLLKRHKHQLKVLGVIFILLITFVLVYMPHWYYNSRDPTAGTITYGSYPYPLHVDEWQHIHKARELTQNKNYDYSRDLELGFHIFLAGLFLIIDPVLDYQFLPAIFAVLASLTLFFLIYYFTKQYFVSIFAMIFFASLRSNINILGPWFFVPLTMSFFLIYLFTLLFVKGTELKSKKHIIGSIGVLLALFLIHPISGLFIAVVSLVYLLINPALIKDNFRILSLSAFMPAIVLFVFSGWFWQGSLVDSLNFILEQIIFKSGWGVHEVKYNIFSFYGLLASALVVVGALFSWKDTKKRFFIVWIAIGLALILLYHTFNFSIFVPYQRALYYTMLGMVPLSAIGLHLFLRSLKRVAKKRLRFKYKKHITGFIIIVGALIFFSSFISYYKTEPGLPPYQVIDELDYNAILWLAQNYGTNNKVLAPVWISTAVYPISGNNIIASIYFDGGEEQKRDVNTFFSSNCSQKRDIIKKYQPDFVISRKNIDCDGLTEVYGDRTYVYEVSQVS